VFATQEAAWAKLDENDPEGVASEYEVIGCSEYRRQAVKAFLWSISKWDSTNRLWNSAYGFN
jgi:hypothetical protein